MGALEVSLDALGAEHAAIEGELFPRLEADHFVVPHLQPDPALLAAEAAMGVNEPVRFDAGRQPRAGHRRQVRTVLADDVERLAGDLGHARYLTARSGRSFK